MSTTAAIRGVTFGIALLAGVAGAAEPAAMTVTSPAFEPGGPLPVDSTCEGGGSAPLLTLSNVPASAKSLAIIVDDPDAPGGTFVHWVLYNVPPGRRVDASNGVAPAGAMVGLNSKNDPSYAPACPPSGRHRYRFEVYALDSVLPRLASPTAAKVEEAMKGHVIGRGELVGVYEKTNKLGAPGLPGASPR